VQLRVSNLSGQERIFIALRTNQHNWLSLLRHQNTDRLKMNREVSQPAGVSWPEHRPVVRIGNQEIEFQLCHHLLNFVPPFRVFFNGYCWLGIL
jgi:hypothetical protein